MKKVELKNIEKLIPLFSRNTYTISCYLKEPTTIHPSKKIYKQINCIELIFQHSIINQILRNNIFNKTELLIDERNKINKIIEPFLKNTTTDDGQILLEKLVNQALSECVIADNQICISAIKLQDLE